MVNKKILVSKIFWSAKFFGQQKFWSAKIFGQRIFFRYILSTIKLNTKFQLPTMLAKTFRVGWVVGWVGKCWELGSNSAQLSLGLGWAWQKFLDLTFLGQNILWKQFFLTQNCFRPIFFAPLSGASPKPEIPIRYKTSWGWAVPSSS